MLKAGDRVKVSGSTVYIDFTRGTHTAVNLNGFMGTVAKDESKMGVEICFDKAWIGTACLPTELVEKTEEPNPDAHHVGLPGIQASMKRAWKEKIEACLHVYRSVPRKMMSDWFVSKHATVEDVYVEAYTELVSEGVIVEDHENIGTIVRLKDGDR